MMFKLMRPCINVERPEDLWFFNPDVEILYYPDGKGILPHDGEDEQAVDDWSTGAKTFTLT